jgi:hypothetical protein
MDRRLSGNQIVVIVLALCGALVLAPVGVYAAATQKVSIVDAKSAKHAVKVDSDGRLQVAGSTDVTGNVNANVSGNVNANVAGTVSSRPAPPAEPFHREAGLGPSTILVVGAAVPAGKNLALTSVQLMFNTIGGGWNQVSLVAANPNGTCPTAPVIKTVANLRLGASDFNEQVTFPVPVIQAATATGICVVISSAMDGQIVVDGYTY